MPSFSATNHDLQFGTNTPTVSIYGTDTDGYIIYDMSTSSLFYQFSPNTKYFALEVIFDVPYIFTPGIVLTPANSTTAQLATTIPAIEFFIDQESETDVSPSYFKISAISSSTPQLGPVVLMWSYSISGQPTIDSGSGVVAVATDPTLTGGIITTSGTLGINLTHPNTWSADQTFQNIKVSANNTYSLGDSTNKLKDGYFAGKLSLDGYTIDLSTGATTNQVIQYNGTKFVPATVTSGVSSVSNSDGTLTISPTTGAVVASLNTAHANTFSAKQTFNAHIAVDGYTISPGNAVSGQALVYNGTEYVPQNVSASEFTIANDFPGEDIGAKINAADNYLGANKGTIVVLAGDYDWTTQVMLNDNHSLYLQAGYYTVDAISDTDALILLNNNTRVYGDGYSTIIEQPHSNLLIDTYLDSTDHDNDGPTGIIIHDFRCVPANAPTAITSFAILISIGNAHQVEIYNMWFDLNQTCGVNIGGGSNTGNHGSDVSVHDCIFDSINESITLAVVNSANFQLCNNLFLHSAGIDLEINIESDVLSDFVISNNTFKGDASSAGAIQVQGGTRGTIQGNTLYGGGYGRTAIQFNNSSYISCTNNTIDRFNGGDDTSCLGIAIQNNSTHILLADNIITNCALTSPSPNPFANRPIEIRNSFYCTVRGNYIASPIDGWTGLQEVGTADYNVIADNTFGDGYGGAAPYITLLGVNSVAYNNIMPSYIVQDDVTYIINPGGDLGVKINLADSFMGDGYGTIIVPPGNYTISTPIVLHNNKTLHFGAGYYANDLPDSTALILIHDNFTFYGDGWNTIIEQPTGMVVVAPHDETIILGDLPGSTNVNISNLQIVAPASPRTSTGGETALAMGNSSYVSIDKIYFNGTYGIDIELGGTSNSVDGYNYHAHHATVRNCVHKYITDDAIKMAVVNCSDWTVTDCIYDGAVFDIEPNIATDSIERWSISGCTFRGGSLEVQSSLTRYGTISGNTFDGYTVGSGGIQVNGARNISIVGNTINGYNGNDMNESVGMAIYQAADINITGNIITNCSLVSGSPNPANAPPVAFAYGSQRILFSNNYVASPHHGWSAIHDTSDCVDIIVKDNYFGLGSGTWIQGPNKEETTLRSTMNGLTLPQATIDVLTTYSFYSSGSITVLTDAGEQTVSYTGKTPTSFTGCSGGTGTLIVGSEPDITLTSENVILLNNIAATGDGTTSQIIPSPIVEVMYSPADIAYACSSGYTYLASAVSNAAGQETSGCSFVTLKGTASTITCSGVRFFWSGANLTIRCSLWNGQTTSRIAYVDVTTTGTGIYNALFTSPQVLTQGLRYVVSMYETTGTRYEFMTAPVGYNASGFFGGPHIIWLGWNLYDSSGDIYPNSSAVTERYCVAPILTVI